MTYDSGVGCKHTIKGFPVLLLPETDRVKYGAGWRILTDRTSSGRQENVTRESEGGSHTISTKSTITVKD